MSDQVIEYARVGTPLASRDALWIRRVPWEAVGLALIIVLYLAFIVARFAPAIAEPDDNGYFAQGSLLLKTGHTWFRPESNAQYIGMHWLLTPNGNYISRYPPGLAVLVAAAYALFGYKGAAFVNPALSILALPGMYLLGKRLVSRGWALVGVLALAANPTYVHHALSGDAHMGVAFCLIWGTYFLLSWSQDGKLWQAFAAGVILGCIPAIRYPDAIVAGGIAVFLILHVKRFPRIWRHYGAALAGVAIPVVPLLIRNQLLLGAFWRTGYALTNEQTGFGWGYFAQHWYDYIQTTLSSGGGYFLAIGIVGIVWMICLRQLRAMGIMLALFVLPFMLLYMAYYWGGMGGGGGPGGAGRGAGIMRFMLPTFPFFILAATWALSEALKNSPKAARIAVPLVLLTMQMLWGIPDLWQQTGQQGFQRQALAMVTDGLEQVAHKGDVVLASNQILQNLDFVRDWKLADPSLIRGSGMRRFLGNSRDPDAPSPMQAEKQQERAKLYSGTTFENNRHFARDIQTWANGQKVYLVGAEREINGMIETGDFKIVKRIKMPEAPPQNDRRDRGFGGGAGGGPGGGAGGPPGGGPGGPGGGAGFGGAMFNFRSQRAPDGGGPGGPGGMFSLGNEKELVIAEWIPPRR